jgi:hypothetical protein
MLLDNFLRQRNEPVVYLEEWKPPIPMYSPQVYLEKRCRDAGIEVTRGKLLFANITFIIDEAQSPTPIPRLECNQNQTERGTRSLILPILLLRKSPIWLYRCPYIPNTNFQRAPQGLLSPSSRWSGLRTVFYTRRMQGCDPQKSVQSWL